MRVPAIYKPDEFYTPWSFRLDNEESYLGMELVYRKDKDNLSRHPLLARASKFKGNAFVVVHENDELVPKETTDAFIHAFNAESYQARGFTHNFRSDAPESDKLAYKKAIADWLQKTTKTRP